MNVNIEFIRQQVIETYYKKKFNGRCRIWYSIVQKNFIDKNIEFQNPPYFLIDFDTVGNLIKKHGKWLLEYQLINLSTANKLEKGVFLISPKEWI